MLTTPSRGTRLWSAMLPRTLQIRCGLAGRYRLLLHAGLHKTGTSAVQAAFAASADRLRRERLLYPGAGRPSGLEGHHNVAWQLAGDRRFQAGFGTLDEVAAEIGRFAGDAILSSEDFESVLGTPERLLPLVRHPVLLGRDVILLIYVRDQVSYLESLFLEMLHHGMARDARCFCDSAIANGEIGFEEWRFHFDYEAVRNCIGQAGLPLMMRPYAKLFRDSIVPDLLRIAGHSRTRAIEGAERRANERDSLVRSLAWFCAHRLGSDVDVLEPRLDRLLGARLAGRRAHLSFQRRSVIRDRFTRGNESIAHAYGFSPRMVEAESDPSRGSLDLEAVFSEGTVHILQDWFEGRLSGEHAVASFFAQAGAIHEP